MPKRKNNLRKIILTRYVYHEGAAPTTMDELKAKIALAGDHVDKEAIRKCFAKSKRRAQGTVIQNNRVSLLKSSHIIEVFC